MHLLRALATVVATGILIGCTSAPHPSGPAPVPLHTPGPLADTWTFNGHAWKSEGTARGPSARYLAALAYDAAHREYVLFGGETARGSSSETWIWNGSTW